MCMSCFNDWVLKRCMAFAQACMPEHMTPGHILAFASMHRNECALCNMCMEMNAKFCV